MVILQRRNNGIRHALACAALYAIAQSIAFAQSTGGSLPTPIQADTPTSVANRSQAEVVAYWTPNRILNAKPIELHPSVGANGLPTAQPTAEGGPSVRTEGAAPTIQFDRPPTVLIPEDLLPAAGRLGTPVESVQPAGGVSPTATSSTGAHFTTYRVFPDGAVNAYPNKPAGKLLFSDPNTGGDYICSASVIQRRLVVTAGHCVSSPSTNPAQRYFYTNFMFIPGYRNGVAPVGTWTPSQIRVTQVWYASNGSVPNAQDVAIMVMRDNGGSAIGNVTGWYGSWTNRLALNHLTMIGYPGNLDNGQRMEMNQAGTFANGGNNTYIYGSAMRGGSSGGPWIQDYGIKPVANPGIPALGGNYVVSVTSYGPVATGPKYQGASNLDNRFTNMFNNSCAAAAGNCQ